MKKVKEKRQTVRVVNGKRLDPKAVLARREAFSKTAPTRPQRDRKAEQQARVSEVARVAKLRRSDGGKEGARTSTIRIRISEHRTEPASIRARPGTFEWSYGRHKQNMLFHAGSHLAIQWERAGIAVASSSDFLRGTASGYATGISDARLAAIDKLKGFVQDLGRKPSERLIDYCVLGLTSTEIARKEGVAVRDIPAVLRQDLRACAEHFRFLGKPR